MEYALLVPIVASLLPKQHPQLQKPLLIAHAQSTPTESIAVLDALLVRMEVPRSVGLLLLMLAFAERIFFAAQPSAIPVTLMRRTVF